MLHHAPARLHGGELGRDAGGRGRGRKMGGETEGKDLVTGNKTMNGIKKKELESDYTRNGEREIERDAVRQTFII